VAAWGQSVPISFTVENRGGAAAGDFRVQLLVSSSNRFDPSTSVVLRSLALPGLGPGGSFSHPPGFAVTLPDSVSAQAGLPDSGPVYLGLRILPADPAQDAGVFDKSGVHRGVDWETLTIVVPLAANGTNHTPGRAQVLSPIRP
jgi:hypothetical protein